MKPSLLLSSGLLAMLVFVAATPKEETAPDGAVEKINAALDGVTAAKPKAKRTVLVFSRTAGFRHASIATGKVMFEEMAKKTDAFDVVISDDLANFEPEKISRFDAIVFLSTTQNAFHGAENEKALQDSLMSFIRSGKGFIGIHAATDTFYNWPEYGEMMNGYFDGHPWTADKNVHIFVEPGKEEHPLVVMFEGKPVEFKEEIYQFKDPYDSKKVDMLLRLDPKKSDAVQGLKRTDNDYGVAWARNWEKGRVFYTSLGHNHEIYWHPKVVSHYLAGIQWALGDLEAEVVH
jgi:type 1 glutamine amidotransferase